jgi:hypothetical protein
MVELMIRLACQNDPSVLIVVLSIVVTSTVVAQWFELNMMSQILRALEYHKSWSDVLSTIFHFSIEVISLNRLSQAQ